MQYKLINIAKNSRVIIFCLVCCICLSVNGQDTSSKTISTDTIVSKKPFGARLSHFLSTTTLEIKAGKGYFVPLPVLSYTPETKVALGLSSIYLFHFKSNDKYTNLSSATLLAIFTTKGQIIISPKWNFYIGKDKYRFSGDFTYKKYPDVFFGIGNNNQASNAQNYTAQYLQFRPKFSARVAKHLFIGLQYRLEYCFDIDTLQPGLLESSNITGNQGYLASGPGITMDYDTRDNAQFPFHGTLISLSNYWYNPVFGSDQSFNNIKLDVRQFFNPLESHHFIALQGYAEINIGDPPFRMMPDFGGYNLMRGYFRGFYRDNNMLAFQTEYRFPIWWKFRGVLFGSTGDVFDQATDLSWKLLKVAGGAGLRFTLDPKERINLRFDVAYARFHQHGVYFGLFEAF